MHCTLWLCLYFLLVARATNTTTDNPSTTPIPVASSLPFSFPTYSTIYFASGIHPCLNGVNYAFLAIQGHIRRVTHSYKHVSPWVSILLILSGDVSINPGPNTSLLTGSLINIRSIRNKSVALAEFINSNKSDIIAVTETWLRPDDTDSFIGSVTPPGYKCTHVPRQQGRGGGVGFFIRDDIDFKVLPQPCFNTFESISVHLSTGNAQDIVFHTVYRPPNVSKANFIEDFSSFVEDAALSCCENVILGDLNLHLDKQDGWSQKFNDSLCQYNFTQIIDSPTHIHGHILDVICVTDTFSKALCAKVIAGLSDHFAITFSVNIPIEVPCKFRQVNTRKIHKINITDFKEDILNSDLIKHPHRTASLLSHQFFNTLRSILDKHAPIKRKMAPVHPDKGFVNSDILSAKRLKCKCERVWRSNNSAINRRRYRAAVNRYNFLLEQSRRRHYSTVIAENNGNPKALWNTFKKILHKTSTIILPDHISPTDLANTFGHFFSDKIVKIRVALESSVPVSLTIPKSNSSALTSFEPVSEDDILKILRSSNTKSSDLDPIPTALVKECADILVTPITNIINYSLKEGSFPNCFKTAYVTPLLKKPNLDRNLLKNYRPVSNLSFLSKLIEKVVAKQLNNYIDSEGLSNVNQSAYRRLHSTETALLKIQNDIAASLDSGKAVALTLLDLSAAFDTIDHDILFNSLRDWFGVDGTVLRWIRSYLSNRKQKVKLGNSFSDVFSLPYGVPQGSVLGPLLFTLYTTPLSNIISNFNVTHHLYADDTQIYLALDNRNFDSSFAELTECLTCIQNWMAGVKLKLNPEKTEFIIIGDRQARESLINKFPTQLLGNSISPTDTVKNLGVIFDSENTFSNHITNMCRACYYHLKDLRRIRKFLSVETAALLANSMISSRLDYCNSLLYGISKYNVAKLQKIQNALCRIVFRLDRTSHVTPFLQKLHWLPITYRILFKYNLITFKAINFSQPIYLSSLIKTSCLTWKSSFSFLSLSQKGHR